MSETLADLCGNVGGETTCEFWCLDIWRFPKVDVDSEATYYTTPGGIVTKKKKHIWLCSQELCHMMAWGWGQEVPFGWNPKYEEFSLSHALLTIRRRWRNPLAERNHKGERMWKRGQGNAANKALLSAHHGWSHPGRAVLAHQLPPVFTPVVSAEFRISCEEKRLGSSADFRWRCLWTLLKFQGSYVWKRLLAEKPHCPPTSLSIWMLPPV